MKSKNKKVNNLIEKDFYELLDIEPGATDKEIEDAYRKIKKNFSVNSIATHSLFSEEEKQDLIEKVTEAYEALISPKQKRIVGVERNDHNRELMENTDKLLSDAMEPETKVDSDYRLKDNGIKFIKSFEVLNDAKSLATEQYRFLCSRLEQTIAKNKFKVFAITSAIKGEGKTTTAINMAYIMAHEFRKKVLLVDGDLRNPSLPTFFEFKNSHGLADILTGRLDPSSALQPLLNSSLTCLTASSSTLSNPSELLSSSNMKGLINSFKIQFDYVLIDCPPILPVVDMNILSDIVDALLLVVRADKTPRDLVLKALKSNFSSKIAGIVLNGSAISAKKYSYYYKY